MATIQVGQETIQRVAFGPATGTITLQAVRAGAWLAGCNVVVDSPFDGGVSLVMGTTTTPGAVFSAGQVALGTAGQYANQEVVDFASADFLVLTITPGATVGSGHLVYRYRS